MNNQIKLLFIVFTICFYSCQNKNVHKYETFIPDINLQKDYFPTDYNLKGQFYYLCKIWGFLKYNHPNIREGKFDWDSQLILKLQELKNGLPKENYRNLILDLINNAGSFNFYSKKQNSAIDSEWINDTVYLSSRITKKLKEIYSARIQTKENYFAEPTKLGTLNFKNEKSYSPDCCAQKEYRLLLLFRYWNVIKYYYPYLYDLPTQWDKILYNYIPAFKNASNELELNLTFLKLASLLKDSHIGIKSEIIEKYRGNFCANLDVIYIDSHYVIKGKRVKKEQTFTKKGDILLSINSVPIQIIIDSLIKIISASNKQVLFRDISYRFLWSKYEENILTLIRNGDTILIKEKYYYGKELWKQYVGERRKYARINAGEIVADSIGYIKMDRIFDNNQDTSFDWLLKKTKGLILDFRCYPNDTYQSVIKKFIASDTCFAKLLIPDVQNPGKFKIKPAKIYSNNSNIYNGKVVILVNENTQSHAEYSVMAFQTISNSITIGNQTAGTDGNIETFLLPFGIKTKFTGLGVLYPSLKKTQRVGIVPEIVVKKTQKGIYLGKDEILESAINYLKIN